MQVGIPLGGIFIVSQ